MATIYHGEYLSRLAGQVLIILGDPAGLKATHKKGDVIRDLNYADAEFCRRTESAEKVLSVTTVSGTWEYSLNTANVTGADVTSILAVFWDTGTGGVRRRLDRLPEASLRVAQQWQTISGDPVYYYEKNVPGYNATLGLHPVPASAKTVTLECTWAPVSQSSDHGTDETMMFDDTDQPRTPAMYHQALVHRAAAERFAVDNNIDQAAFFMGMFDKAIEEYRIQSQMDDVLYIRNVRGLVRGS